MIQWQILTRGLGGSHTGGAKKVFTRLNAPNTLLQLSSLDSPCIAISTIRSWRFAKSTASISSTFSAAGPPDFFIILCCAYVSAIITQLVT